MRFFTDKNNSVMAPSRLKLLPKVASKTTATKRELFLFNHFSQQKRIVITSRKQIKFFQ